MDFSIELQSFPSKIQKTIYCEARELTPLSVSVASVSSAQLRQSCKQYYDYYVSLLSDMYDNPSAYHLPVGEYETFLNGKTIYAMKQKEPQKALKVVSHVANCVNRYTLVLSSLGYFGRLENNSLRIPEEAWKIIEKNTCVAASPIPLNKRLCALERLGLTVKDNTVTCDKYPLMFSSMKEMAAKTKGKPSGFHFYAFQKADFRNIEKDCKPTYVDYYNPLSASNKDFAYKLHDYALKSGCRVSISTFLKVDYKYKGSQVMCVESANNSLRIRLTEVYSYNAFSLIEDKVKNESKEFEKYFLQHIWRCKACSTTHLGMFVKILGTKNRVCGGGMIGLEWINPAPSDLEFIEKFIDFRCAIINELENKKP